MKQAAQRVDIAGKKLTNLLGELLSGKDYNLIGEVSILSEIKEAECFLMPDEPSFNKGVEDCRMPKRRNPIWREWCLPDYKTIPTGFELNR